MRGSQHRGLRWSEKGTKGGWCPEAKSQCASQRRDSACVSDATGGLSKHQAQEMTVGLDKVDRGQGQSRRRS